MKFETGKKILKINGTLLIIGAIITILLGIFSFVLGGAGTQMPDVTEDPKLVEGVAALIFSGIGAIISGICSLVEGIFSRLTGKNGRFATVTLIFAILGVINAAAASYNEFSKSGLSTTTIISASVLCVLSVVIFLAAIAVKKGLKNA